MLEDLLAIEVVHQAKTSWTRSRPATRRVDVLVGVVHGERRARGRRHAEAAHQRLGAVVAGAHAHALAAEDLGHVVRVDAVEREGDERAALVGVGGPWIVSPGTAPRRSSA